MERGEISIKEICAKYEIKQSAAYKWRKALKAAGVEESWENFDKIHRREINVSEVMRGGAITVVEAAPATTTPVQEIQQPIENYAETINPLGITVGRLQELNAEAKLEANIKFKLVEFHESQLQSERSQLLNQRTKEVSQLDPKKLGEMLSSLGVA